MSAQAEATIIPSFMGTGRPGRGAVYGTPVEQIEYLALTLGDVSGVAPVLVRVQTTCFPGDVFGSAACDCGPAAARRPSPPSSARGAACSCTFIRQGGSRCSATLKSHVLHERGARAWPAAEHKLRDFGLGAQVWS